LTRFLRTALARDPQARFASAEDMQCELHAARADESCLWMQRPGRGPSMNQVQPVGPISSFPPAAKASGPRTPVDSSVWGVLPDPPAYDEVRRPPTRSGVKALLLGFGLTFGVGALLVFRAQTRDAELSRPVTSGVTTSATPTLAGDAPAAPLAVPASSAGVGDQVSSPSSAHSDQALGSGSVNGGIPASEVGSGRDTHASALQPSVSDSVAAQLSRAAEQLSRAAAQRPASQPTAVIPAARRRAVERPRRADARPEEFEAPPVRGVSQPSVLPDNPY
jgi:hypothetical protein